MSILGPLPPSPEQRPLQVPEPIKPRYVAYYRLSVEKKDRHGKKLNPEELQKAEALGMQAQENAVLGHVEKTNGILLQPVYREFESGKRHENRPALKAALGVCKKKKAILIIAKLDRLARNVAFISALMDDKTIDFVACDMPEADRFTIHIFAAMAEKERDMISMRTKNALHYKKIELAKVGKKLGPPDPAKNLKTAWENRATIMPPPLILKRMKEWRAEGRTLKWIAEELGVFQTKTAKDKKWFPMTVKRILERAKREEGAK